MILPTDAIRIECLLLSHSRGEHLKMLTLQTATDGTVVQCPLYYRNVVQRLL